MRPAHIRFYLDADILGVAKVLVTLRPDVTYPGDPGGRLRGRERPPCPVTSTAVKDHEWIPVVAAQGWLAITRDNKIEKRPAEIAAVREHRLRLVALDPTEATDTFAQLEVLMTQWRRIEALHSRPAPFIQRVTRSTMTSVDLGPRVRPA